MAAIPLDDLYVVCSNMRGDPVVCFDNYEEAKEVLDQNNAELRRQNPRLTRNPAFIYTILEYVEFYHECACDNCDRE